MSDASLQSRFPKMKPVKSAPTLFTFNSFGVRIYGRRDVDRETGTYVKTRCLCALFIPLFPLDSWRVADAPTGGWYFLGKEPVSPFASGSRWVLMGMIALIAGGGAWSAYTLSPKYRLEQGRKEAATFIAGGKPLVAAEVYHRLLREDLGDPVRLRAELASLLKGEIASGDAPRAAAAIKYADDHQRLPGGAEPLLPDLADLAFAAAAGFQDPAAVASVLSAFKPEPAALTRVHQALRDALEKLHQAHPEDRETGIRLALIREEFGETEGALELLEPAAGQLGEGEGARLLGTLLVEAGRVAEGLPHLERYVAPRQKKWQREEQSFQSSYEEAQERAIDRLNGNRGPAGFKSRYDAASEEEKARMVDEYVTEQVQKDPAFLIARERYQEASKVTPAIMELGIARLRMAQGEKNPAERKTLLAKAEEAFLALRSVAGESDEYRLFLGQIYFWSGRESEGRKLFDELLAAKGRDVATLYGLANIFRDLGEEQEARERLEEAFGKSTTADQKNGIVRLRSLLARTNDERIEWLQKGDPGDSQIGIDLAEARGRKAEEKGDIAEAERCYREALAGYGKLPTSTSVLNNSAILLRSLYRLAGDPADFEKAARLTSEAVGLAPSDSILCLNAAESLCSAAAMELAKGRMDPRLMQFNSGLPVLQYLYRDEASRGQLVAALKADPNFRKGLAHFWDALLLSPKNPDVYAWGAEIFELLSDTESLERLAAKAAEQEFDFSTQKADLERYLKGERDQELRDGIRNSQAQVDKLLKDLKAPEALAMAQVTVATQHLSGFPLGIAADGEWLASLRQAAERFPCSSLNGALKATLETVALERLAKADPECAAIVAADRRQLAPRQILCLLIRAKGELGERVRRHPAVIEARQAARETDRLFPSFLDLEDWLLMDGLDPAADAALKTRTAQNRRYPVSVRISRETHCDSGGMLLNAFWEEVFAGHESAAREMIPTLEAAGLKLPELL